MEYAGGQTRTNLPSTTKEIKETFNPQLVLMMLMYPTLIGFVLVARLATFALIIPTPTVPCGAPPSSSSSSSDAEKPADLWETVIPTVFAFTAIALVHYFIVCYLVRGPPGPSFMATHRNGRFYAWLCSIAFWFTTTCFLFTYSSMARYGAHDFEWYIAILVSLVILVVTLGFLCAPPYAEKVVVGYPPRATV